MLNVINHQGNANENHNEISPHTCKDGTYQNKTKQKTSVGKDVEERMPMNCIMAKIVNFMLCIFYHKKVKNKKPTIRNIYFFALICLIFIDIICQYTWTFYSTFYLTFIFLLHSW